MSFSRIKVPIDSIRGAAEKIRNFTDNNGDMFERIVSLVREVESCGEWQGKSVRALIDASEQNKNKFSQAMSELDELATFLTEYAKSMENKDVEIKNDIQKKLG